MRSRVDDSRKSKNRIRILCHESVAMVNRAKVALRAMRGNVDLMDPVLAAIVTYPHYHRFFDSVTQFSVQALRVPSSALILICAFRLVEMTLCILYV